MRSSYGEFFSATLRGKFASLHNLDTASRRATRNRSIRDPGSAATIEIAANGTGCAVGPARASESHSPYSETHHHLHHRAGTRDPLLLRESVVGRFRNQINHLRCIVVAPRGIDSLALDEPT